MQKKRRFGFLSNNALKIIAAAAMVCDHAGVLIFTDLLFLRIIGRLAFPIFAFLIAEGAKHTRSKKRHLIVFVSFAAVIQLAYFIFDPSDEMSVMVTFTLSLLMIYALDAFKEAIFTKDATQGKIILTAALFIGSVALAVLLDNLVDLDYGLSGALLPLFPAIFTKPKTADAPDVFSKVDTKLIRVGATALGTFALSFDYGGAQFFSLFAIPILLLYSEKRGKFKMKYFFYIFYPLHLVILFGIALLIHIFK